MEDNNHYVQGVWDVRQLLKEWKLDNIWPHLVAEKIDCEILQMIKIPHIRMLLGNFPLGIQIRFEHSLEQWRYNIGRPLQQSRCDGKCEYALHLQNTTSPTMQRVLNDTTPPIAIPSPVDEILAQVKKAAVNNSKKKPPVKAPHTTPETPVTRSQTSTPSSRNGTTSMPYTSKPHGPVPKVRLREILMNSPPDGPQIMQLYKLRNSFCRTERRRLVNTIVNYYLVNDLKFSLQTSYALERAILKLFPTERLDMYRRAKRGSIYCKYMSAKPVYAKKHPNFGKSRLQNSDDDSDMETGGYSEDASSQIGRDGNRISSGCYSINEDETQHIVANMADDEDGKSQYTFSVVTEKEERDVKPTIVEDTEISIQTAYKLRREVIRVTKPFLYEQFLTKACACYGITKTESHYITVNDCEINRDEFESVVRQYYKLPTFVVELKQRSLLNSELVAIPEDGTDNMAIDDEGPLINVAATSLPDAKAIRNIPPLRHIVMLSNASKQLENKHRTAIAKAVIDECLSSQPDRSLKRQEYLTLAHSICEAFPGEEETTYYVPSQPNYPARGKLWSSFKNKRHFLGTTGILKTRPLRRSQKSQSHQDETETETSLNDTGDENDQLDVLEFEENSPTDFEIIKSKWRATHEQRWQTLVAEKLTPSEYMEKYQILKSLQGIHLMEIDVQLMFPQMATIQNWLGIYPKVVDKMRTKRVPEQVKTLLKNITESREERYCASLALLLIPYMFPHNGRKNELSGSRGTKQEIQERFIKDFESLDDLRSDPNSADLQLRFVHADQCIIYAEFSISGFIFKCGDLLEALNCLFHYMKAMNIQYPLSCNHIWQFVQCAIYRIELTGVKWPYVESTISDLNLS